jgi:hypothetical protein
MSGLIHLPLTREALHQAAVRGQEEEVWQQILQVLVERRYRPNSLRTYRTALALLMDYLRTEHRGGEFAFGAFGQWLHQRGYQPATVNKRLAQARVLLRELLGRNPQPLSLPRTAVQELTSLPYSDTEVERLLNHARIEERVIVVLALEAGLTVKDIAHLKRADVHFEAPPVLLLQPQGSAGEDSATSQARPVSATLSPLLRDELQEWFARTPSVPAHEPVIASPSQATINAWMRDLCRRADVPYRGLRGLRVTTGARAYRDTGSLQVVIDRLRLKTVQQARAYARAVEFLQGEPGA